MKYLYKIILLLVAAPLFLLFVNASTGPGLNFGAGYTGSAFDGGTCNGCHSGGNFTPAVTIQLLNGTTPVATYVPNTNYTVRINISSSTGITPSTACGFQIVAVRSSNNANAGTWGSLSATNYHSVNIGSRTYVEHDFPLPMGTIDIPWTAPGNGAGTVTFYAIGNVVNQDNSPSGDNPEPATPLVVPVNPLPTTWLSFDGKSDKNCIALEWVTTKEMNGFFVLERSVDGKAFSPIATVEAKKKEVGDARYTYLDSDQRGGAYYKIKNIALDKTESVFKIIHVASSVSETAILYARKNEMVLLLSADNDKDIVVELFRIDGSSIMKKAIQLTSGNNVIALEKPMVAGLYIASVRSEGNIIYSGKVLVE